VWGASGGWDGIGSGWGPFPATRAYQQLLGSCSRARGMRAAPAHPSAASRATTAHAASRSREEVAHDKLEQRLLLAVAPRVVLQRVDGRVRLVVVAPRPRPAPELGVWGQQALRVGRPGGAAVGLRISQGLRGGSVGVGVGGDGAGTGVEGTAKHPRRA
jgi:hypothetical protein